MSWFDEEITLARTGRRTAGKGQWITRSQHEGEAYRALRVNLPERLPQTVYVGGQQWERNPDPHVTMFDSRRVRKVLGEGEHSETIARMAQQVSDAPIHVTSIGPEWRVAEKGDRRSLVVGAEVEGTLDLYGQLSRDAGREIPVPPLHVTVYMAPGKKGIGLALPSEWEQLTRPLTERERADLEGRPAAGHPDTDRCPPTYSETEHG